MNSNKSFENLVVLALLSSYFIVEYCMYTLILLLIICTHLVTVKVNTLLQNFCYFLSKSAPKTDQSGWGFNGPVSLLSSPLLQWRPPQPQCHRVPAWVQYPCPSLAQSPARSPVTTPPPPPRPPWCQPPAPTAARPLSPPNSPTLMGALPTHRTQVLYMYSLTIQQMYVTSVVVYFWFLLYVVHVV